MHFILCSDKILDVGPAPRLDMVLAEARPNLCPRMEKIGVSCDLTRVGMRYGPKSKFLNIDFEEHLTFGELKEGVRKQLAKIYPKHYGAA